MKRLKKKGSVTIILCLVMVALCGFTAYVIDIGLVYVENTKLSNAIDAASLAAVQLLPDTIEATNVANQYIELNGFSDSDISVIYPDSQTINITGNRKVNYVFAKILGINSTVVMGSATAQKKGMGGAFNYVLFSGSKSNSLAINGSEFYISGSTHSNKNFSANCSKITITGLCEAMTSIAINGSQIYVNNRLANASFVDMPDFSETVRLQAEKAGQSYTGNKTYNGSSISINNSIYVNGDISVNTSKFSGKGCIVATGNITFNGSNINASSTDAVCFYSKNGNININASSTVLDGILYAPKGAININGSTETINGRIIGNTVAINTSTIKIIGGTNELSSLPSSSAKLIN